MAIFGNSSVPLIGSTLYHKVIISFFYVLFILLTIVGNIFVMITYVTDKKIRKHASNLIILHLATVDFVVGAFTLTFNMPYLLFDRWIFGRSFCKVWVTVDYLTASVSSAMITCFTTDRFLMVVKTLEYRALQTRYRMQVVLAIAWLIFGSLNAGLVYGWEVFTGYKSTIDYAEDCDAEFRANPWAVILYSSITGYVPLLLVAAQNVMIVVHLRKQISKLFKDETHISKMEENSHWNPADSSLSHPSSREISNNCDLNSMRNQAESQSDSPRRTSEDPLSRSRTGAKATLSVGSNSQVARSQCEKHVHTSSHAMKMKIIRYRRNIRAAIQLGVLVTAFAICWLPFEIISAIGAFGNGDSIREIFWEVTANLQWANSAINPLLYAATNRQFRINFARYLSLGRWR